MSISLNSTSAMHGHDHVLGPPRDRGVDQGGVGVRQLGRVLADAPHLLAQLGVAEIGEIHLVDLEIAAAGGSEIAHLLVIDAGEVGVELGHVGIGFLVDRAAAAAEMHVAGGGDGLFRGLLGVGFHELEVIDEDALGPRQLAVDAQARRRELDVALRGVEPRLDARRDHGDVGEALEEIEVPEGAAELAVGDRLEPKLLLQLDRVADRLVLDPAQLLGGDGPGFPLVARVEQFLGAQQAADMVGAERRRGAGRHGGSPRCMML
jgi:hypothetical protein